MCTNTKRPFDGLQKCMFSQTLNDCAFARFVYDGPDVVLELSAAGGFAYRGNVSNQVIWAWVNAPGLDQPVERIAFINGTPRQRQVFHADGLGSIAALTDGSGATVQTYTYAAFGSIRTRTCTDLNRVTFTAREALGDSLELYYYRNRVLDPTTGRFTSEDPLGFVDGPNRYVYVGNNPVNYFDPNGLFISWGAAVIGAGVNIVAYALGSWLASEDITTGGLAGAATSGFVAGAVVGALSGDISALGAAVVGGAVGGLGGSAVQQAIDNGSVSGGQLARDTVLGVAGSALTGSWTLGASSVRAAAVGIGIGTGTTLGDKIATKVTRAAANFRALIGNSRRELEKVCP